MRISDWSSDVCSSDLQDPKPSRRPYFHQTDSRSRHSPPTAQSPPSPAPPLAADPQSPTFPSAPPVKAHSRSTPPRARHYRPAAHPVPPAWPPHRWQTPAYRPAPRRQAARFPRSEEHTSELQSLMRISYAVFCLKKKNTKKET